MSKSDIISLLLAKGFSKKQIVEKRGGIEIVAEKRTPVFEFDYNEFVFDVLNNLIPTNKIHFLDPWTMTIECE